MDSPAGDFFRDLGRELEEASRRRRGSDAGAGYRDSEQPKSLWEELADIGEFIGEELLEFLEKQAGISYDAESAQGEYSGSRTATTSASPSNEKTHNDDSRAEDRSKRTSPSDEKSQKKTREEELEDELQALKRKLGKI